MAQPNYGTCGDPWNPSDEPDEINTYCGNNTNSSESSLRCYACDLNQLPPMQYNYMDYSDDHCLSEFTYLQGTRMLYNIITYRSGLVENWEISCEDNLDSLDSRYLDCTSYNENTACGIYDDEDFTASEMCCLCGKGPWNISYEPSNTTTHTCEDLDNGGSNTDSAGDTCAAYVGNTDWCNDFDDIDFTSSVMCCACGGGTTGGSDVLTTESIPTPTTSPTLVTTEETTTTESTDDSFTTEETATTESTDDPFTTEEIATTESTDVSFTTEDAGTTEYTDDLFTTEETGGTETTDGLFTTEETGTTESIPTQPYTCTIPEDPKYNTSLLNGSLAWDQVENAQGIVCALGYAGSPVITRCASNGTDVELTGSAFVLSGCSEIQCTLEFERKAREYHMYLSLICS